MLQEGYGFSERRSCFRGFGVIKGSTILTELRFFIGIRATVQQLSKVSFMTGGKANVVRS